MTAKDGYSKEPKWPRFLRVGLLSAIILTNQQQHELRAQPSSIEWTVDGCELSVSFPYQYREYETIVHRPPNYVPAKLHGADTTNNGLLRAECGVVPRSDFIEHMREESFLLAMMEEIGNNYALNLRTYSITEFGGKPVAELFGQKKTERGTIVMEISNYIMDNSILTVYTSHFIDKWPFAEAEEFRRSVRRK